MADGSSFGHGGAVRARRTSKEGAGDSVFRIRRLSAVMLCRLGMADPSRPYENIYLEFSGMPPHAGATRMAVDLLGADRIVWGGHLPSRSYANELSKVYDGNFSDAVKEKILGQNLRGLAAPIMREKGYDVTV